MKKIKNVKNIFRIYLFFLVLLFAPIFSFAATIYSTEAGGNWNNPSSWEGGVIKKPSIMTIAPITKVLGISIKDLIK